MIANDCVSSGLEPYIPTASNPWDKYKVLHLFNRLGFGISPEDIDQYLQMDPSEVVDLLVDEALDLPLREKPDWADKVLSDYEDNNEAIQDILDWVSKWIADMWDNGLREKMALFWHNHFVTEIETYFCPSYLYSYHRLLQLYALGNFKELTIEMGKTPAMLIYLNGVQNSRLNPNENYARELLELFTLGRDNNYTQNDVMEVARALTGFNGFSEACAPIEYAPFLHDSGRKTIFGQTDLYDYESFHDLLFQERSSDIADHICKKLVRFFVGREVSESVLAEMSSIFLAHNFEIGPVLRALFKSEYFWDKTQFGTQISSPVELLLSTTKNIGIRPQENEWLLIYSAAGQLGQQLLNPPNVAGWEEDQNWLNSSLMALRWSTIEGYYGILYRSEKEQLADFGRQVTTHFDEVDLVCRDIVNHIMPWGLPFPEDYEAAVAAFKFEIPQNYFDEGLWDINWNTMGDQVAVLLVHLSKQPEFQLK